MVLPESFWEEFNGIGFGKTDGSQSCNKAGFFVRGFNSGRPCVEGKVKSIGPVTDGGDYIVSINVGEFDGGGDVFFEGFAKVVLLVGLRGGEFIVDRVGHPLPVGGFDGVFPDVNRTGGGEVGVFGEVVGVCEVGFLDDGVVVVRVLGGVGIGNFFNFVIGVVFVGVHGEVRVVRGVGIIGFVGIVVGIRNGIVVGRARVIIVERFLDGFDVHFRGAFKVCIVSAFLL